MFEQEAANFRRTWERLKNDADALDGPAKKAIEFQARRLCKEFLLKELANRSLIPGSGFPTAVVPFDTLCAETQKARSAIARTRRVRGIAAMNARPAMPTLHTVNILQVPRLWLMALSGSRPA